MARFTRREGTQIIAAVVAALVISPMVHAQQKNDQSAQTNPIQIYKDAGIDGAQEQKILKLANAYEHSADQKAHEIIEHLKRVRALSLSPELNERALVGEQNNINKLQGEMAMDKIHLLIDIRHQLNDKQRLKLVDLMRKSRQDAGGTGNGQPR